MWAAAQCKLYYAGALVCSGILERAPGAYCVEWGSVELSVLQHDCVLTCTVCHRTAAKMTHTSSQLHRLAWALPRLELHMMPAQLWPTPQRLLGLKATPASCARLWALRRILCQLECCCRRFCSSTAGQQQALLAAPTGHDADAEASQLCCRSRSTLWPRCASTTRAPPTARPWPRTRHCESAMLVWAPRPRLPQRPWCARRAYHILHTDDTTSCTCHCLPRLCRHGCKVHRLDIPLVSCIPVHTLLSCPSCTAKSQSA